MKMNTSKTKVMYTNKPSDVELTLKASANRIGVTDTYKYLGVWLKKDLDMSKRLNNGYKMAYQKVFKLGKIRKQLK